MLKNKKFFSIYSKELVKKINNLDLDILEDITNEIFSKIKQKKNIFVCGNGGSAAVANHFLCDFNKGIKATTKKKLLPRVISLNNSNEIITAISNDLDYKKIFSSQLENLAEKGDLLFVFSCSGNSKNIKEAIVFAKKKKLKIVQVLGFKKKSKISYNEKILALNCYNYGIAEDIFQSVMHMVSQRLRVQYIKTLNFNKLKI
jgi:phosphoheptose isomerase|tara:strand:+ start:309 stop:914 length:606 start_codon:yes stop_codon:yes gene_type:complete